MNQSTSFIEENALEKTSAKCQPLCLSLNVLNQYKRDIITEHQQWIYLLHNLINVKYIAFWNHKIDMLLIINQGLSARLQYLQCKCTGDTAVRNLAMEILQNQSVYDIGSSCAAA